MHTHIDQRKVPQILALAANRVGEWYSHSWKWLSRLRVAVLMRVNLEKRLSTRTMRIDQREAILALLKVVLSHLDLKTMQIGIYNPETDVFTHLSLDYLAHKAGLSLRRTQRAMAWLYDAGYIIGYRQSHYDAESDEFFYKPSIRKVAFTLLQDLGITELAYQRARSKSRKHLEKFLSKFYKDKKEESRAGGSFEATRNIVSNIANMLTPKPSQALEASTKIYTEKIKRLMDLMPNLSFEEAKRMLPNPSTYN